MKEYEILYVPNERGGTGFNRHIEYVEAKDSFHAQLKSYEIEDLGQLLRIKEIR